MNTLPILAGKCSWVPEVGFADNLGEYRVQENRQELVGIERHHSNLSDWMYRVGGVCS